MESGLSLSWRSVIYLIRNARWVGSCGKVLRQPTPVCGVRVREFSRSGVARQSLLSALSAPRALALPRREAAGVEMVFVQFGYFAVDPELSLELHLIPPECFSADRAGLTAPGTAHDAVGTPRR